MRDRIGATFALPPSPLSLTNAKVSRAQKGRGNKSARVKGRREDDPAVVAARNVTRIRARTERTTCHDFNITSPLQRHDSVSRRAADTAASPPRPSERRPNLAALNGGRGAISAGRFCHPLA